MRRSVDPNSNTNDHALIRGLFQKDSTTLAGTGACVEVRTQAREGTSGSILVQPEIAEIRQNATKQAANQEIQSNLSFWEMKIKKSFIFWTSVGLIDACGVGPECKNVVLD